MTEENALAVPTSAGMTQADREELMKDDGLGFITLQHGVSDAVMNNNPKGVRAGDFLLNSRTLVPGHNNGPGFRAFPFADRPRAVYFKGKSVEKSSFKPGSADWNDIAGMAAAWTQGAKVGFEVALWLPDFDFIGVLMFANKERTASYPKVLAAMQAKQAVQITTALRGQKNQVILIVNPLPPQDLIPMPKADRFNKCLTAFEAYKSEKAAPAGARR